MRVTRHSLLLIGIDEPTAATLGGVLSRSSIFAESMEDAQEALELSQQLPFDVLVLGFPLPGINLTSFLAGFRRPSSPSRHAAVLLFAAAGSEVEAEEYVGRGANRVVAAEDPPEVLEGAIAELLGVAPRFPLRVALRVEVALEKGTMRSLCQTENVSSTGMLIRGHSEIREGHELRFELSLPRDPTPVCGKAVVVRRSDELREKIRGVAVQIVSFEGKDGERFQTFINTMTASRRK